jgi:NADPH2:quinone reductase
VKAIRIHSPGDAGVLSWEDADVPRPAPGQALLRIEAVGVNFVEIYR